MTVPGAEPVASQHEGYCIVGNFSNSPARPVQHHWTFLYFLLKKGAPIPVKGLTEEQLKAKEEADEQEKQYREKCLSSTDQLPTLPDGEITLTWDMEQDLTQIRNGESVIWSEPVVYEGFDRFEQIAHILKDKYGNRLKDLVPTDRSKLFLYGDYEPSLAFIVKLRKELFGVDAEF